MKVALLQLNPTIGALEKNADRLVEALGTAKRLGASVAISSELALVGYPPRDLLDRPAFVARALDELDRVVRSAPEGLTIIVGALHRSDRRFSNAAVVARSGRILAVAEKRLLPSYDVFDDVRHFEPGRQETTVLVENRRFTITICEDVWGRVEGIGSRYHVDPLAHVNRDTTDVLVNLSGSPFTLDKLAFRPQLFADVAKRSGVPVVLVNQVGANDELVFDGRSSVWSADGELVARAPMFEESVEIVDLDGPNRIAPEAQNRAEAAYRSLVLGVADYARKCGFRRAVVGLSGGIDSALVATIARDALGAENVTGISMPTRYSSKGSLTDAALLAKNLGIRLEVVDIDPIFATYLGSLSPLVDGLGPPGPSDVTWENVQARIRGATLMAASNRTGAIVLTTGNKSELSVGYCTLYGDMVGGLAVISDVPKVMVYEIARWLNRDAPRIPRTSIDKAPSAELRPNQTDQDSLPPYEVLDPILELYVEKELGQHEIVLRGFDPKIVERVLHLVRANEYKRRQAAPGLIITSKAFGPGRRMPLAQGFEEK